MLPAGLEITPQGICGLDSERHSTAAAALAHHRHDVIDAEKVRVVDRRLRLDEDDYVAQRLRELLGDGVQGIAHGLLELGVTEQVHAPSLA